MSLSGTVTLDNTRLSLVNGVAFFDTSASNPDYVNNINSQLEVMDSAGKKAIGYIKSAGTGETLSGTELVTNGTFDSDIAGWTPTVNGGTIAWDATGTIKFTEPASSVNMYATQSTTTEAGALYKASLTVAATDNNYSYIRLGTTALTNNIGASGFTGVGTVTMYRVAPSTVAWFTATYAGGGTRYANQDNMSLKQVLTPSTTGVTITSTPNGSTYNWASIESGFNYNDASGYSFKIIPHTGFRRRRGRRRFIDGNGNERNVYY